MPINYNLIDIVNLIANNASSLARLDTKFESAYIIPNVDEATLLDIGFEYEGLSFKNNYPLYKMNNICAHYNDLLLYAYYEI